MRDYTASLVERINEFGNHFRRHLQAVNKNLAALVRRLEERKKRDRIHLLHPSNDFAAEIKIVADVGETIEEKTAFAGTYFALQYLLMNRYSIDHLRMQVMAAKDGRFDVYRSFMRLTGNAFRTLTSGYIRVLLGLFTKEPCEFAIMGVGTKSDQDDIDIGIIDDGSGRRGELNRAIALVSREMQRYATSFHFHLSEHIGRQQYSASIAEYRAVLQHEIRDFVIINEMLSAGLIIGSEPMFEQYRREITERYFYAAGGDNRYHEGYLRGILGEILSLLARPISATTVNFKEDALRIIKSMMSAGKTVFQVRQVNTWDIIAGLKEKDERRRREYAALERSLTFFEIFRHLYQLFVTQDEEVYLDEVSLANIRRISRVLGYTDTGKCRAEDHILVHYYEHIRSIRNTVPVLVDDLKEHLKRSSLFAPMFRSDYTGNMVVDYIEAFRFFRGTAFWEDILDDLRIESVLKRFVQDLSLLSATEQEVIIGKYVNWVKHDLHLLIEFLTILGGNKASVTVFENLNARVLKAVRRVPDVSRNLAFVFYRYPQLINRYLALNPPAGLRAYLKMLESRVYEPEIAAIVDDLKNLINLQLASSAYFRRILRRVLERYPESLRSLAKAERLREFGMGIHSDVSSMPDSNAKKERLGDYYDFEMMRVGLACLNGAPVARINAEFIDFSDTYIQMLADICRQEIDAAFHRRIITDDILAIFAAGGHAREQAFDDDYDLIVILDCDDQEVISYCNKLVSRMNTEIIKRGTIPHHRFAEYFGRFVICLSEIEILLSEDRPEIFIEKSQIFGARLIVGSHRFEKEFVDRVVKAQIFGKKRQYINQMINELYNRRSVPDRNGMNDIKECSGGLRDIEMMMFIVKAKFGIKDPVNARLFEEVAGQRAELKQDLKVLRAGFDFLSHLRDLYRLTAGASDTISEPALQVPASIMGFGTNRELFGEFRRTCQNVSAAIDRLIKKLNVS